MPDLFAIGGGTPDAPPAPAPAPAAPAQNLTLPQLGSGPGYVTQDQINAAANAAGLDPDLFTRVVRRESGGRYLDADGKPLLGPMTKHGQAQGPAQVMAPNANGADLSDPVQNLTVGAKMLRGYLDRYGGDQAKALAAYNSSPDAVDKAGGVPNIPQTQAYVHSIMGGPDLMALGAGPGGQIPQARYVNAQGNPLPVGSPQVDDRNALAATFLQKNGFRSEGSEPGSSTNPIGLQSDQTPESARLANGQWYLQSGKLRQAGDPTDDYIPQYQRILALRDRTQGNLGPGLTAATGFGQGLIDVGQSANKLTGGALEATGNMLTGGGFDLPQMARSSLGSDAAERNDYNLLFGSNPLAAGGRFLGQAIPVTAATMGLNKGLGAFGDAGEFLAGEGGTNLLTQSASRAAGGALQGVTASGLTSATSDRPLGDQLTTGAVLGSALGVGAPVATNAGVRLVMGPTIAEGPVKDLANLAATKYGMTGPASLRAGQIKGALGDRAAATADSELLGSSPRFLANNEAQRQKWMQGVTSTYGDASGDVSPGALMANKQAIGGAINDVADRVGTIDANTVPAKLDAIVGDAKQVVGADDARPLQNLVKNIKSTIGADGALSAAAYQGLTRHDGPLMTAISNADTPYATRIKETLDDALQASADPSDVAALQQARWQYKNLMTVAKAAQNQNNIGADGVFTPAALNTATTSNFKQRAFRGAGDLDELNAIRKRFMTEPPNSYTADRGAFRLGGLDTAIAAGAEGAGLLFQHPEAGLAALGGLVATKSVQAATRAAKERSLGAGAGNRLLNNAPPALNGIISSYALPGATLAGKNLLLAP